MSLFKYYDILFIRIYNQYINWKEDDIPKLTSLLVLSLFQSLNVLAVYFFVRSFFEKSAWEFSKFYIVIIMVSVLLIDYVRIFKVVGFEKLLKRYGEPSKRKLILHPVLYFILSFGLFFLLKVFNRYPHISE